MARPKKPTEPLKIVTGPRLTYTLGGEVADAFRKAMEDDESFSAEGDIDSPLTAFWKSQAFELKFDPDSIVIKVMGDEGDIQFTALSTDPLAEAAPAVEDKASDGEPVVITQREEGFDAEGAHNAGLTAMEEASQDLDLLSASLAGDLTNGLLEIVKRVQKPWDAHSQGEKRDLVAKLESISTDVIRQVVDVVASDGRETVKAVLEKVNIGDKTMLTLKLGAMPEDEAEQAILTLFKHQKKTVMIVTADANGHMSRRRELVPPDQDDLPFDAGSDKPSAEGGEADEEAPAVDF